MDNFPFLPLVRSMLNGIRQYPLSKREGENNVWKIIVFHRLSHARTFILKWFQYYLKFTNLLPILYRHFRNWINCHRKDESKCRETVAIKIWKKRPQRCCFDLKLFFIVWMIEKKFYIVNKQIKMNLKIIINTVTHV